MKYWMVTCARGHCGSRHETEIKYAISAENLIHALNIAKSMPSVKHTRMPLYGHEITEEEYLAYREQSAYKRYECHRSTHYEKKVKSKRRHH